MAVSRIILLVLITLTGLGALSAEKQDAYPLISLPKKQMNISEVLEEIKSQTSYSFSYMDDVLDMAREVSFEESSYRLDDLLNSILDGAGLTWEIKRNLIILRRSKRSTKKKVTISGYVKDAESSENLIGAHVINEKANLGVVTNAYGFFSISSEPGNHKVSFSYLGYATQDFYMDVLQDTLIQVSLAASTDLLDEIVVTGLIPKHEQLQMSNVVLNTEEIKSVPAFLGEPDVLKTLQLMPGVQSGQDGTAGIYVRGGGPDQNLILLDGVPVYNANHLFGMFSVFNPDAIKNVELIKGGFPARYGGRLSSVMDISMKEGNLNEFEGEGALGNIMGKITVQGPLKKGESSYMLSARRSFLDLFTVPIGHLTNSNEIYAFHFGDLNAKVNHIFSDRDRIYLSAYSGKDRYKTTYRIESEYADVIETLDEESNLQWGNVTTAFRWNHLFGPKLFSNATATYSQYRFSLFSEVNLKFEGGENDEILRRNGYRSSIRDFAGKIDFDYLVSNAHHLRFGASGIHHYFEPGLNRFQTHLGTDTTFGSSPTSTSEFYAYIEDEIKLSRRLSFNLGVHASGSQTENTFYHSIQPRFSANLMVAENASIKASYASMAQYIHLLVNSGVGLPTDLWLPVTDEVKPQRSEQVALGTAVLLFDKIDLSVEGYYKWMYDLLEYKDGAGFLDIDDAWHDKIEVGDGYSYGLEFLIQKKTGRTRGWLGYTWSKNRRDFENLNGGREFPYRYDRTHDVSISLSHQLRPHIDLSAVWVYGTGFPLTLATSTYATPQGHITGDDSEKLLSKNYPSRNSSRANAYHRMDVSISFKKEKKWGERKWVFGLYNAYSHMNPSFVSFRSEPGNRQYVQTTLFPLIPAISYQFKF